MVLSNRIIAVCITVCIFLACSASYTDQTVIAALKPSGSPNIAPSNPNIALYKSVTASSNQDDIKFGASKVLDGNYYEPVSSWESADSGPHWLEIDFGAEFFIGSAGVYLGSNDNSLDIPANFELQASGTQGWSTIPGSTIIGNTAAFVSIVFDKILYTDKIRFFCEDSNTVVVRELEIYHSTNASTFYKSCSASGYTNSNYVPDKALNGTRPQDANSDAWRVGQGKDPDRWVEVEFERPLTFGGVAVFTQSIYQFRVTYFDGAVEKDVPGGSYEVEPFNDQSTIRSYFVPFAQDVTTDKLKIYVSSHSYKNESGGNVYVNIRLHSLEYYLSGDEPAPIERSIRGPVGQPCPDTPDYHTSATHYATADTLQGVLDDVSSTDGTVVIETTGIPANLKGGNADRTENILIRPPLDQWLPPLARVVQEAARVTIAGWTLYGYNQRPNAIGSWIWRCAVPGDMQLDMHGPQQGGICEIVSVEEGWNNDRIRLSGLTYNGVTRTPPTDYIMTGMWLKGRNRYDTGGERAHCDTIQFTGGNNCVVKDSVLLRSHSQVLLSAREQADNTGLILDNIWADSNNVNIANSYNVTVINSDFKGSMQINPAKPGEENAALEISGNRFAGNFTRLSDFRNNALYASEFIPDPILPVLPSIWGFEGFAVDPRIDIVRSSYTEAVAGQSVKAEVFINNPTQQPRDVLICLAKYNPSGVFIDADARVINVSEGIMELREQLWLDVEAGDVSKLIILDNDTLTPLFRVLTAENHIVLP